MRLTDLHFLADENIELEICEKLSEKYQVTSIAEKYPGMSDPDVLEMARKIPAVLLTQDKDFGELAFFRLKEHTGVMLLRMHTLSGSEKAEILFRIIPEYADSLVNNFTVITPDKLRQRANKL